MNMKMNFSMDEIRLKVEEYIKKGGRAAGRPVLTAYYVMTADSTPESERTNIMIALVAIVFPTSIEDLLGQVFMVGKGFAAVYAYKKVKKLEFSYAVHGRGKRGTSFEQAFLLGSWSSV